MTSKVNLASVIKTLTSEEVSELLSLVDVISDQLDELDELRALEVELEISRTNTLKRLQSVYASDEELEEELKGRLNDVVRLYRRAARRTK